MGFLTGSAQKVLSVRLQSKSHQKVSEFTGTGWHLELLGGCQLKKSPCITIHVKLFVNQKEKVQI